MSLMADRRGRRAGDLLVVADAATIGVVPAGDAVRRRLEEDVVAAVAEIDPIRQRFGSSRQLQLLRKTLAAETSAGGRTRSHSMLQVPARRGKLLPPLADQPSRRPVLPELARRR